MKSLIKSELHALDSVAFQMYGQVVAYLEDHGRKIYGMSLTDKYRLLRLRTWMERHKVTLEYILDSLLPYYQKKFKTSTVKKGLGVKVTTLTGKKSEQMLVSQIAEDFPNGENVSKVQHEKMSDIIASRLGEDDEFTPKVKSLLDFKTPEAFTRYYQKKTQRTSREFMKETERKENKLRRYRGSPWI